ncbi:MAG: FKBP-type peptidyl-prolyl cis-trans isomerase, partial [Bacteroidia bacterium]
MTIEKETVVSVDYHLTAKIKGGSEELVEKTEKANPFVFLFGGGMLLEDFEKNLKGKKIGDTFDFHIEAKNGYGLHSSENVVNVPIEAFKAEDGSLDTEMVKVGSLLPMLDNQGHRMEGMVEEVTEQHVRMDFNHPLAGQDLHFVGEVLDVRKASAEELD